MTPKTTKFIYVIGWSIFLLMATFPIVNYKEIFPLKLTSFADMMETYIYPMIMALTVYLADVVYAFVDEENRKKTTYVSISVGLILFFLLFFCLSMCMTRPWLQVVFFALVWITLTGLKFVKTTEPARVSWKRTGE